MTDLWRRGVIDAVQNVVQLRRPLGVTLVTSFVEGFGSGLMTPVDIERGSFRVS